MKLKTTKALAKELNKSIKDFEIQQQQLTAEQFKYYVDFDIWNHENDFDTETSKFNVFCIIYKDECYANNQYVTTNDLTRIFKRSNKTLEDFTKEFYNEYQI